MIIYIGKKKLGDNSYLDTTVVPLLVMLICCLIHTHSHIERRILILLACGHLVFPELVFPSLFFLDQICLITTLKKRKTKKQLLNKLMNNFFFLKINSNELLKGAVDSLAEDVNHQREEAYKVRKKKRERRN